MESRDPDDSYHMVSQLPWEEDIIWDGQDEAPKIMSKISRKCHAAGWIPSGMHRRASEFNHQVKDTPPTITAKAIRNSKSDECDFNSIFPVENQDLVYGLWEQEVIWDSNSLANNIPARRILTLDPNDENIIFEIPEDVPINNATNSRTFNSSKAKNEDKKKNKLLLGKSEVISPAPEDVSHEKQPWNASNDEYYTYKITPDVALKPNVGNLIQHSTPAVELRQPFFPTFMNRDRLREFHRPPLFIVNKRSRSMPIDFSVYHAVESLTKHIARQDEIREKQRIESGGGEMFFMHTAEDLSGKDAELILAEYSEEYPPLMNQVSMATKIKNYIRKKSGTSAADYENKYEYGESSLVNTIPFLGNLNQGQSLQTIDNNMYRAPIYRHKLPTSDFLVIKTGEHFWVREVETIFTVGQELPIIEVPGPNSKKANNFIRDFLQVYIYRMFWRSQLEPKRIKMDDIKKAFPLHSESSIRKRLKQCADFNRTGDNPNMWYLKKPGEFRLPQEAEIRTMVIPEQCCAYYSMLSAERRLQDAGYGERSIGTLEDDDDEDKQKEMDDEVKAAPWNTTRAFISAMKQKCLLQLSGVADPTGCNEGFSYVRVPNKPLLSKEEAVKEPQPKKTVTGTDADLRRLKLDQAKAMLRESGYSDEELTKLQRWDIISLVRALSTKQVRAGEESMSKFARGNRFSIAEHQERYKDECQRIFDLQNRVLASDEILSTDDEESNDEEDPEIEQVTKTLEFAIENKKSSQALSFEREEAERRELYKRMFGSDDNATNNGDLAAKKSSQSSSQNAANNSNGNTRLDNMDESSNMGPPNQDADRVLHIYRTYRDNNGREYTRTETVRKQAVIDSYVKICTTKDRDAIREFTQSLDDPQKESKRKERKQTRKKRVNNNENNKRGPSGFPIGGFFKRESPTETPKSTAPNSPMFNFLQDGQSPKTSISPDASTMDSTSVVPVKRRKQKDGSKLQCSACGGLGHMKNNRSCPAHPQSIQVAMTQEQFEEGQHSSLCASDLIKTEDTKILINKKAIENYEEIRKNALKIRIPVEAIKRKRGSAQEDLEYLKKPEYKQTNRRPTDPLVALSVIFENIVQDLKELPHTKLFWAPVNMRKYPDYYNFVKDPIDLGTIRSRCNANIYTNRDEFLVDIRKLYANSQVYNGPNDLLTQTACKMVELAENKIIERSDKIQQLENSVDGTD